MTVQTVRTVWGYDPRWLRVEHVDESGVSLGRTEFERAPVVSRPLAAPRRASSWLGRLGGWWPWRRLRVT